MTLQQIDVLCDEFEAALRQGDTVRIEDFLLKIDESQQSALIKELIEVEIQFTLEKMADAPSPSEDSLRLTQESLKRRFPEEHKLIQSLFKQSNPLKKIGDYDIISELGHGGMGVVYKAKHQLLQQTVAVKVLSQAILDDSQAIGRFKREMQLIGGITHPNVVRALNAGEIDGMHYLAMEFVEGFTLQKLTEIMRDPTGELFPILPIGAACEAIRQAALGLQDVHDLKLVHRDIKPANLMVDRRGTVKILDLGLGKFAEDRRTDYNSSLTVPGMVIGTVDYISPEQCENSGQADIRSDLYSLGCSFFFLLTGKPVYSGSRYDTMRKKLMAHIVGEVPSLQQIIPDVPKEVDSILQKILAKNPDERFQTPMEFAEALMPFASFDELWAVICEAMPTDSGNTASGLRQGISPYPSTHSKKTVILPSRSKWTRHLMSLGLLFTAAAICVIIYFAVSFYQTNQQSLQAQQAETAARTFWNQWNMPEALKEYQKAVRIRAEEYFKTDNKNLRDTVVQNQFHFAMTRWYCGDYSRARQEMQSLRNNINDGQKREGTLSPARMSIKANALERLGDFILFGGAALGNIRADRLDNGIAFYAESAALLENDLTENPQQHVLRLKQAILWSLSGNREKAEPLIQASLPTAPNDLYAGLVHQLAEAVLYYYQKASDPETEKERDQQLRAFQRQFRMPSNDVLRTAARNPEVIELLQFDAEFLINDSIRREDWKTLADDFTATNNSTANFLRQNPGATFFMRRLSELLIHSAVLLHDHSEQPKDKQRYVDSIIQILKRTRFSEKDAIDTQHTSMEKPTLIFFFLPESNKPEEGLVIFYPQDGREGTLYPLALTRQMVKQRERGMIPPLPAPLMKQAAAEKVSVHVSWNDRAAWSPEGEPLSDSEYPYKEILPLR